MRIARIGWVLALAAGLALASVAGALPQTATGVVFHDKNGNGVRDAGEPGLSKIPVSNGMDVVLTDAQGRYTLTVDDWTTLFVIKPSGWKTAVDPANNVPQFFYVHRPQGSPEVKYGGVAATGALPDSVDFALEKQREPKKFRVLCLGDTQPRNQTEVDYQSQELVAEVAGIDAAFGMTLGDLVFDDLSVLEPMAASIGMIGIPWRHVIGNHDIDFDAPERRLTAETYQRVFGPDYYAFNYGQVHFIVLNNIFWDVEARRYHAELGDAQLTFIENNLRHVPQDRLIVLMMHIPLMEIRDKDRLFALLQDFPNTFSLSAHWHRQEHFFLDGEQGWPGAEPHHHLVKGTACGSWWTGQFDPLGVPHATMADGTPRGYSVITFDGTDYSQEYKVMRRPAEYQMNIHAPNVVAAADAASAAVVVNVFFGSERSTVDMRLGDSGPWIPMQQVTGQDPFYVEMYDRQVQLLTRIARDRGIEQVTDDILRDIGRDYMAINGRTSPVPRDTGHLWTASLPPDPPPGSHFIHVRTTDMYGQTHTDRRVIRIE
jgi:hypothetical protein